MDNDLANYSSMFAQVNDQTLKEKKLFLSGHYEIFLR